MTLTKDMIAKDTNAMIQGLSRLIETSYELDFEEGQVITVENAESWTNGGEFTVESTNDYTYCFSIENESPCHLVDYDNQEEVEVLSAENCEKEKEALIASGTKFVITYVSTDEDAQEMGYYTVELEYVEED